MSPKAVSDPFQTLLEQASKKFAGLAVGPMNSVAKDVKFITTGNLAIDYAIGGGLPFGRSVELYGPPSCGKTTTALQVAVAIQKIIIAGGDEELGIFPDSRIVYLDYEQTLDKDYATALGLDLDHPSFIYTAPDTLESGANFVLAAVKTGKVRLFVFDSVAGMNPSVQAEQEDVGKATVAIQAKLLKPFGTTLNSLLANHNAIAIFLNHEKEKIGIGSRPGMPPLMTTPGGMALKYFASVRVRYQQIRQNKGKFINPLSREVEEIPTSTDVKVKVEKNKVAPPFRQAVVRVRFGKGFDNMWTALQVLLANKLISYQAGRFYFHKAAEQDSELAPEWMSREKTGTHRPNIHGEAAVFDAADEHPEWRQRIIDLATRVAHENADTLHKLVPVDEEGEDDDADLDVDPDSGEVGPGRRVKL